MEDKLGRCEECLFPQAFELWEQHLCSECAYRLHCYDTEDPQNLDELRLREGPGE